ncbi:MAG: F0F1 ATP synthase subunit gamma [Gammaproteobacteria bacterium]|nr:F0F1 ATP synthase subunit gamma [Gammaproteobacteria bacterium]
MANAKEIRTKIGSIGSTQKITRAMEMVAASKMRRARERVITSRPYADKMRNVITHLAQAQTEVGHPYLRERPIKRVGLIVISSDRGLCGGLNNNLFKTITPQLGGWQKDGIEVEICTIGSKAVTFFKRMGGNLVAQAGHLGDTPSLMDLIGTVKVMLDAYDDGRIDRLHIAYNDFINTMTQEPRVQQLLPVSSEGVAEQPHSWDYLYEPDSSAVLDALLTRYVESLVYQAVVENAASEQAARMVAMKAASDNATNLIDELQLVYNKARQASITQELAEIVAGAAAV